MSTNTFINLVGGLVINAGCTHCCCRASFASFHELRTLFTFSIHFNFTLFTHEFLTSSVSFHPVLAGATGNLIGSFIINTFCAGVLGGTRFTALHKLSTLLTFVFNFYFILLTNQLLTGSILLESIITNTYSFFYSSIVIYTCCTLFD